MPYRRLFDRRRRPRPRGRGGYKRRPATRNSRAPQVMSRSVARTRRSQNLKTHIAYFRYHMPVSCDGLGDLFYAFTPGNTAGDCDLYNDGHNFSLFTAIYEQYKILSVTVQLRPHNIGSQGYTGNVRSDLISWIDPDGTPSAPSSYNDKISCNSLRWHTPRQTIVRRMFRQSGNPDWGDCQAGNNNDGWQNPCICLYSTGNTTSTKLYHAIVTWKVIFRGTNA